MVCADKSSSWRLDRGGIYDDVYAKRVDDRPVASVAVLQRASIEEGELRFVDDACRDQALDDGIFMLRIPDHFELEACDAFSRNFYKGAEVTPYGRYRSVGPNEFGDPLLGFHERINQIEQFLLERRFWKSHYPAEIAAAGEHLTAVSRTVLRSILKLIDIPSTDWETATGGCANGRGSYHLTFNHYRPDQDGIGLSSHKDDGFITILRTTAPGLEVNRNDQWETVEAENRYFIVNFGLSMEVLTRASATPVRAIMHRVRHQTEDRFSFGHFTSGYCEPGAAAGIYAFSSEGGLEHVCSSRELIDANDEEIYLGTRRPIGSGS